jgi:hypothetical protein
MTRVPDAVQRAFSACLILQHGRRGALLIRDTTCIWESTSTGTRACSAKRSPVHRENMRHSRILGRFARIQRRADVRPSCPRGANCAVPPCVARAGGLGMSLKTWPRWALQAHRTSVRRIKTSNRCTRSPQFWPVAPKTRPAGPQTEFGLRGEQRRAATPQAYTPLVQ